MLAVLESVDPTVMDASGSAQGRTLPGGRNESGQDEFFENRNKTSTCNKSGKDVPRTSGYAELTRALHLEGELRV